MELVSQQKNLIVHFKDSLPVAVTFANGSVTMYKLTEMNSKDVEEFFEVDRVA